MPKLPIDRTDEPVTYANVTALFPTRSGKALWCELDGHWVCVPYSQICPGSAVTEKGDEGDLVISAWFAHIRRLPKTKCHHGFTHWHRMEDYVWCYGPFRHPPLKLMRSYKDPSDARADHEGYVVTDEEIPVRKCFDCGTRNKVLAEVCELCGRNLGGP